MLIPLHTEVSLESFAVLQHLPQNGRIKIALDLHFYLAINPRKRYSSYNPFPQESTHGKFHTVNKMATHVLQSMRGCLLDGSGVPLGLFKEQALVPPSNPSRPIPPSQKTAPPPRTPSQKTAPALGSTKGTRRLLLCRTSGRHPTSRVLAPVEENSVCTHFSSLSLSLTSSITQSQGPNRGRKR